MSDWIYPYVHDNSTNMNPDKMPYWSYCTIAESKTTATHLDGRLIRLSEWPAYTAARPIVTYLPSIAWYTTHG